jgi:hypothetical protein
MARPRACRCWRARSRANECPPSLGALRHVFAQFCIPAPLLAHRCTPCNHTVPHTTPWLRFRWRHCTAQGSAWHSQSSSAWPFPALPVNSQHCGEGLEGPGRRDRIDAEN